MANAQRSVDPTDPDPLAVPRPRSQAGPEYNHLTPMFLEFAALVGDDPRRDRLRSLLVEGHLPVAHNIARRFTNRGEPEDDLRQVATIGLLHAVDRFDPFRAVPFLGFAIPTITGEVRRYFRDAGWAMRVPRRLKELSAAIGVAIPDLSQRLGRAPTVTQLADHLQLSREEIVDALAAGNSYRGRSLSVVGVAESAAIAEVTALADLALDRVEHREALAPLIRALPDRERTILALRFFGDMTQSQIAARIGLSQMHVSRLLSTTLAQLRADLDG